MRRVKHRRIPKLPDGKTRYLTPGELKAALETAPDWMRAPMTFAACTGVRRGEMLSLRWMDVELGKRRLYLRETKNGTTRVLPISDSAVLVLKSLPEGSAAAPVFAGVDAEKLSVYTKCVFESLGIMDASFHTLRHTAASWLVMQGVDLYAVGQILGHKTPRMTQRYAHLSPEYMAGAVGKLDGIMGEMLATKALPGGHLVTTESPEKDVEAA
jgi:integrase